jgi:hypothetical protein
MTPKQRQTKSVTEARAQSNQQVRAAAGRLTVSEREEHILSLEALVGAFEIHLGERETVAQVQHTVH